MTFWIIPNVERIHAPGDNKYYDDDDDDNDENIVLL